MFQNLIAFVKYCSVTNGDLKEIKNGVCLN